MLRFWMHYAVSFLGCITIGGLKHLQLKYGLCSWKTKLYSSNSFTSTGQLTLDSASSSSSKSTVQNSGIILVALSGAENTADSYYGWIEEIWEMDYIKIRIPLFLCKWIDNRRGVRQDKDGMIIVDFNKLRYQHDPFIMAKDKK